jgi:phosphopantothenoylcysteine decarboxylase/phosphopantothenate--cysteine ligase
MDLDMYQHPTFKRNLHQLIQDGVFVIPATSGALASGLEGQGRMEEPEQIVEFIKQKLNLPIDSIGKRILVTAGPTYESIDPVRFVGNHSSGKMGFELAKVFLNKGHHVSLISGPTNLELAHPNLNLIKVESAVEMLGAVQSIWNEINIGVFAAAVADYRPKVQAEQKIKKTESDLTIEFIKNPDVLRWASDNRSNKQFVVGFALETNNSIENAFSKLESKNLDLIVLNSLENKEAGFKKDTNKIVILDKMKNQIEFDTKSKTEVASDILNTIENYLV